jgi:2-succinyl-5-enolpyruvyl-6-hydroxy-3-cyclohexene-1-carboxylate synthase
MTHPNASTALAEVIVDELVRCGTTHLVLAPGSRSAAIAIVAARRPELRVAVQIDERSAGFYALGVGRATSRPAVALTTSGSAVAHLHPAVVEAHTGMVPLLLLTADRPPELHGTGSNQTIEQSGLFSRHTRWSVDLGPAEHRADSNARWRATICRAIDEAASGAVHVNIPFREPLVPETDDGRDADIPFVHESDGRPDGGRWFAVEPRSPVTVPLEPRWTDPERGVVIAGEAPFARAEAVDRLAAALGWPLVAEPTLGIRPAQAISIAPHVVGDPALAERLRPDVALVVGRANLSRSMARWLADVPTLIVDPRITDAGRPSAELLGGWPVFESIGERTGRWRRLWLDIEGVGRKALDDALDAGVSTETRIARDVAGSVPDGGVLVAASSMPIRDLDLAMRPGTLPVVSNRGASGIDGFVSTAFGVAAGSGRPVVALAGDLAMLHDSNGFLVDPRPDVVFVVVNNDGGGIFSFLPQVRQTDVFDRIFGTPHGRSFAALAQYHGVGHALLTDATDQVASALRDGGTWILEAVTDRASNPAMHAALTESVVRAVRASLEG